MAPGLAVSNAVNRSGDPDLSRFLEASEPQPDDNVKEARSETSRISGFLARRGRSIASIVVVIVLVVIAFVVVRAYVVAPYYIPSASMEPTLHGCPGCTEDRILVDKISYRFHDPSQGDIVVFDRPPNVPVTEAVLVKRIIAIPGDRVELRNGLVFVNGTQLNEPYINGKCGPNPSKPETGTSSWTIPSSQYFVMGDNRCDSDDSRTFGPIAKSSIVGRVWLIFYPFNRIGSV